MSKYVYPAIFTPEEAGISVEFPDVTGCFSSGDTITYRKRFDNRAVKKTLTIPAWLNDMAERDGINFSATLQGALKSQLHIE